MKCFSAAALCLTLLAGTAAAQQEQQPNQPAPVPGLESDQQKFSYGVGLNIGGNMKAQGVVLDINALVQGVKDGLAGADPKLTNEQLQAAFAVIQKQMQAEAEKAAADEKVKRNAFFAQNAKQEGVKTTQTGLQYKVLKAGEGASPKAEDTVTVHYRGALLDGTEFDSSYKRNQPASFQLNQVIAGWGEGVQLMRQGGKFQFFIPPELGYGARPPQGSGIPPNAILVFEVELLDVKPAQGGN